MTQWQHIAAAILYALLLASPGSAPARSEAEKTGCFATTETQLETNQCLAEDLRADDAELNRVYQKLQTLYAGEPEFLEKLKAAQRAWLAFRDADFEARYPAQDKRLAYGSIYPMCAGLTRAERIRKRIAELKVWETGLPEGEVCGGSVRRAD